MPDILLYIREGQIDWVFEHEDIGSGSSSFKGMAKKGNRVFVASKVKGELAVVGEIPISKAYEETDHPKGWRFRVTSERGASVRYPEPVRLARVKDELSILRASKDIWRRIRCPRWLTPDDAALLSRLGRGR